MHKLNWEDLRYFDAVGRLGSLSKAARSLGVNHSTVYRRIASLEKSIGARLFERLAEGYLLTSAGKELLASTRHIEEEITSAGIKLSGQDQKLSGIVRITTTDSLGHVLLQPHLARFHRRYPDIHIELVTNNVFFNLTKRQADVAVRPTNDPPDNLIGKKTCKVRWATYGSREYLRRRAKPKTPEDLVKHDIIFTDETLSHIPVMRWLRKHILETSIVLYGGSIMTLYAGAKHGFGLTVLPCWLADHDDGLVQVLPPIQEYDTDLWILTHPDLRGSARVRAFTEFLAKSLGTGYAVPPKRRGAREASTA